MCWVGSILLLASLSCVASLYTCGIDASTLIRHRSSCVYPEWACLALGGHPMQHVGRSQASQVLQHLTRQLTPRPCCVAQVSTLRLSSIRTFHLQCGTLEVRTRFVLSGDTTSKTPKVCRVRVGGCVRVFRISAHPLRFELFVEVRVWVAQHLSWLAALSLFACHLCVG